MTMMIPIYHFISGRRKSDRVGTPRKDVRFVYLRFIFTSMTLPYHSLSAERRELTTKLNVNRARPPVYMDGKDTSRLFGGKKEIPKNNHPPVVVQFL